MFKLRPCFFPLLLTPLQLRGCHMFGVPCTGCLCHGIQLRFLSLLCPVGALFLVLSPRRFPSCALTSSSLYEDELHPAFVRWDHCWSHFPYFDEKVVHASFLLYDFLGSPGGQPWGGIGQPRVGLRVTLPFHELRLLCCVLVAHP